MSELTDGVQIKHFCCVVLVHIIVSIQSKVTCKLKAIEQQLYKRYINTVVQFL